MATYLGTCVAGAPLRSLHLQRQQSGNRRWVRLRVRATASAGQDSSYLDMWKRAVERDRQTANFNKIAASDGTSENNDLQKKTTDFEKLLQVSREERDRVQGMQVIDRAAAALAAARALIQDHNSQPPSNTPSRLQHDIESGSGMQSESIFVPESDTQKNGVPGPDFWSWKPPLDSDASGLQVDTRSSSTLPNPVAEKEPSMQYLSIPFESLVFQSKLSDTLPPLQSSLDVETSASSLESPSLEEEQTRSALSSGHAAEAAHALNEASKSLPFGVNPDGSRWWKDTGIERRPDGVICRWTMTRGVSVDKAIEWQEKYWEASDDFGYKELGSEKSGRDANGNVWREFWRESMIQENGLMHIEKTADKWGRNGKGEEWQEKWWEHYNASGQVEKWAHKWCSIDPNTPLEAGHAHVWHERWGETYDGYGGSIKYTDKWAERSEDGGWEKWGDKWDESFDLNSNGVKQGETWWEGKHGERWNRTWGEQHNGSGWVQKYGKSSSGEHWDTHVKQDTWYERFPHYGFFHCYENSVQLREVPKPSEILDNLDLPEPTETQGP